MAFLTSEYVILTLFICFFYGSAASDSPLSGLWTYFNCTCICQDCKATSVSNTYTCNATSVSSTYTCLDIAAGIIIGLAGLLLIALLIICVETCYIFIKRRREGIKGKDTARNAAEVVGTAGGEQIAAYADNCSNALEPINAKATDPDNRNDTAVYSECSRTRSSTAPNVDTTLYSYACVHTRMDEVALSSDRPLHNPDNADTIQSAYATVAEGKTESKSEENTYSSASQNRVVFRNPTQPISNEEDKLMYSEPETNTISQPLQMANNIFFYDETKTTSPTVSTTFQLGTMYDANNTFSLKSLPIEEQLYDTSKRTDF